MLNREQLFKRMNNALLDMQASTWQTFEQPFLTFARLVADPSLQSLNDRLAASLDVEAFLAESSKSQSSFVGSMRLAWPVDADQVLGLKWLLVQKLAREPDHVFDFAHNFYTVGQNINGELHSLVRQLLIPFGRDYKDYIMAADQQDMSGVAASGIGSGSQGGSQNVSYVINGHNARVNIQSLDQSVNTVNIDSSVTEQIDALRHEIEKAPLPFGEKAEALEVVDAVEMEMASGKPKKPVLKALLGSLPAIQSVTIIGKAIYDMVHASGHV